MPTTEAGKAVFADGLECACSDQMNLSCGLPATPAIGLAELDSNQGGGDRQAPDCAHHFLEFAVRLILAMLLLSPAFCLAAAAPPPQERTTNAHLHDHHSAPNVMDEQGQRWPADAPLQHAMRQIRGAGAREIRSTADAVFLAAAVEEAIAYMIRNCSLPADADAALHGGIGQLSGAASTLRGAQNPRAALAMLDVALERYTQLFDESELR